MTGVLAPVVGARLEGPTGVVVPVTASYWLSAVDGGSGGSRVQVMRRYSPSC